MKSKITHIRILLALVISMQTVPERSFSQDSTAVENAHIAISFAGDSTKEVKATLTKSGANGNNEPIKDVDIHFYIKKSFGNLPLEGNFTTTDENGEASVEFPTDIPGDSSGNVVVIARVEDNEELQNPQATATINWGIPLHTEHSGRVRALWASANNAPWSLVVTVTTAVVVVWGTIFYILYQLVRIKKAAVRQTA